MKTHKFIDIPEHDAIAKKVYEYVAQSTDIIEKQIFWNDLVLEPLLTAVPELETVFAKMDLVIRSVAIIYMPPKATADIHQDYFPSIRMLWPLKNCQGSTTTFYETRKEDLKTRRLPNDVWYKGLREGVEPRAIDSFCLTSPVVFNPSILHGIESNHDLDGPRLSMTVTFTKPIDHLLD